MKKIFRRSLCLLLSLAMIASSALCVFAVDYPQGVTQALCEESSVKTDVLVKNAAGSLMEKPLKEAVAEELFKDETLSSLLTGIYSSLSESASVLSILGINISVSDLAQCLSAYPEIANKLSSASGWESVDLTGAKWNISTKAQFADAVGAVFSPFNDVLYMLLCSGTYRHGIIMIPGDHGYEKGLISMLEALGCTEIASGDTFEYEAYYNRNKMMSLIVTSLLSLVDSLLDAPSQKLCEMMPNLADYIKNGGLENSVNALLRPLTIHIGDYVQLFTGSQMISFLMFIQDPGKYTLRFSENITVVMNEMLQSSEITLPEIDLDALISVKGDRGGAYRLIMTWLIDALKLNSDKVSEMLPEEEGMEEVMKIAQNLLSKDSDELFAFIVRLFTSKEGKKLEYQWQSHEFTKVQAQYTEDLGEYEVSRVLKDIDQTINDFIVEMTGGAPLRETITGMIYSNDLLTTLVKGLYGALSAEETKMIAGMLSLPTTPAQLSVYMKEMSLYSAKRTLSAYTNWEKINYINWGFKDGSRQGFEKALTAVLRPLRPALEALLANGTLEIFDSINIGGSNGYNTAVIPLLEALGCNSKKIKTYDKYEKGKGTDAIITDILNPILDLVDKISKKPVYNLTRILPNVLFFVDNGSLMQCLDNLLYPVTSLLEELSIDLESLGVDMSEFKDVNLIDKLMEGASGLTDGMVEGLDLSSLNLRNFEGMGELTQINSKRTYNGERVKAEYVKADQNAVLMTILRFVIDFITSDAGSNLLGSFMGGGSSSGGSASQPSGDGSAAGGAAMFDQYSADITSQMADMSTEEVLSWLYDLFFSERAMVETTAEEYVATIIYVPQQKKKHSALPAAIAVMALIGAGAYAFVRKDSISDFFSQRKERKNENKEG